MQPDDDAPTLTDDDIQTRPLRAESASGARLETPGRDDDTWDPAEPADTGDPPATTDTGDDTGDPTDTTDTGDDSGDAAPAR